MSKTLKRSLTGIRPSGSVHIGNYLGMIRPALSYQHEYQCLYFLADLHALTTTHDPKLLQQQTLECVATWLAFGLDVEKNIMYRQSDLPMVTELAWYLSVITGFGFLQKSHAFKDAVAKNQDVNHGVFAYPVLMAADILLYDSDIVPVGKDQKQHVEMARDMANSFNVVFGEGLLKLPEPVIDERVMTIPGLDGRKMSKSYNNTIPIFAPEKEFRKQLLSIKTDSTPLEEPKSLAGTLLGTFVELFATSEQYEDLERRLNAGGLGWGHAKQELCDLMLAETAEARRCYQEIRYDSCYIEKVLKSGAERAAAIGQPVLEKVRVAVGVGKLS